MTLKDQIRPAVEGPLRAEGLLVEDVSVTPAGRRRLVRIWVDRAVDFVGDQTSATAPLTLDEVADATRAISDALDESDAMGEQPYVLEVTSPGVERPLTLPRHFRRNVSRLLTLTPQHGDPVTGRLLRAGEDDLTLEVAGVKKEPARSVDFRYAEVSRAVVQVEFSRHEQPGPHPDEHDEHDEHDDEHDEESD